MTDKPNAVEEIIARHVAKAALPDWTSLPPALAEDLVVARDILAAFDPATWKPESQPKKIPVEGKVS